MTKPTSNLILCILIGVVAAGGWFAWLGAHTGPSDDGARTLKIAHALPTNHPVHLGLEKLKQAIAEKSGGRLKADIFPNEQLGTEVQCLEKVQAGTLDITKTSAAPIGNFVPAYQVFALPYLFRDADHFWKVLRGPEGEELLDLVGTRGDGSSSGIKGLGYFDSGSRSFYTTKPVRSPADLKGMKIRVMNDPVAMDLVQAVGGSPTPISFGELYTALKQGTVDGAENNPPSFHSSRHYEICKYYTLDHHTRIPDVIVISEKVWKTLSSEEQGWLKEAIDEASEFQHELWITETQKSLDELKAAGVEIIEPDPEPFRKATEPVLRKYSDATIAPLVEKIRAIR
ncbi:MAG: TRAP transporter substrate-binding protein [Akkermansiaceae bacterium]|nr:TRAP transporter substrate-binding protein [Akkermansiaceae bacterium]MCP5549202.1 TRAP transporter substrate-binding protein [Akkermansiaceae bacterium]